MAAQLREIFSEYFHGLAPRRPSNAMLYLELTPTLPI
jgi:hypothetical protein